MYLLNENTRIENFLKLEEAKVERKKEEPQCIRRLPPLPLHKQTKIVSKDDQIQKKSTKAKQKVSRIIYRLKLLSTHK